MNENKEIEKLLQYWYLVEFFNQQDFPYESKDNRENNDKYLNAKKNDYKPGTLLLYNTLNNGTNSRSRLFENMNKSIFYTECSDEIHICVGKISRDLCVRKLFKVTGNKEESINAINGDIAVFGLKISNTSNYVYNSFNLSPVLWAIHKIATNQDEDLHRILTYELYREDMRIYEDKLRDKGIISSDIIMSFAKLIEERYVKYLLSEDSYMDTTILLIYQLFIDETAKERDESFLNYSDLCQNFYSQDLKLLEKNIAHIPDALKKYILGLEIQNNSNTLVKNRLELCGDKLENKEAVEKFYYEWLDIDKSPLGKWPSKFSPSFMQQVAINLAISNNNEIKHFISVNGPPGTGKTTLLKEIISHNIVSRATKLVEYIDPDDAFISKRFNHGPKANKSYDQIAESIYTFKDDSLNDYGMLIASSNNGAVENITKELPDQQKIKASLKCDKKDQGYSYLEEIGRLFDLEQSTSSELYTSKKNGKIEEIEKKDIYFSYYANLLLGQTDKDNEWGLVSAPLGNAKNNSAYYRKALSGLYFNFLKLDKIKKRKDNYKEICKSFKEQLKEVKRLRNGLTQYSQSYLKMIYKKDFMEQEIDKHELAITVREKQIKEIKQNINCLVEDIKRTRIFFNEIYNQSDLLQIECNQENEKCQKFNQLMRDKDNEILELESKLGIFDWLSQLIKKPTHRSEMIADARNELEKMKEKNSLLVEHYNIVLNNYKDAKKKLKKNQEEQDMIKKDIKKNTNKLKRYYQDIQQYKKSIDNLNNNINKEDRVYNDLMVEANNKGIKVLDKAFWTNFFDDGDGNQDNVDAYVANPWITNEYDRAREKLLYLAFQVHKEFVLSSTCCMKNIRNFLLMNKVIKGKDGYLNYDERDKFNAYATLFNTILLFTPVVSTTFASVGKLLNYIKTPKEIGILIIDEAGQAQPHIALGAMYRAKKVIVVGDPKQIEPVVKSEVQAIKTIVGSAIDPSYLEKNLSVQELADIVNPYGRYFNDENDNRTWVGCPLNIHRRCISPMYDISNAISYNHSMKQKTEPLTSKKEDELFLKTSYWLNITGNTNNASRKDYYVQEQGLAVLKIIKEAFFKLKGKNTPDIYIISPFVSVIAGVKKLIKSENRKNKFCDNAILTNWIEKNCGTIHTFQGKEANEVLFLLGCDINCIGAIRWVNTNIINVAVTRAKYRLCIIGDYQVWKKNDLMRKAKRIIEKFNLEQLYDLKEAPINRRNKELSQFLSNILVSKNDIAEAEIDFHTEDLVDAMSSMESAFSLNEKELKKFNLSEELLEKIDKNSKTNLIYGIHIYNLLTVIQNRYEITDIDYSSSSILWCKSMEGHIRNKFYIPLKKIVTELSKREGSKLSKSQIISNGIEKITLKNYINILNHIEVKTRILEILSSIDKGQYSHFWYADFCMELDNFRSLRNNVCHPTVFDNNQLYKLINILFENNGFEKVCIGELLDTYI